MNIENGLIIISNGKKTAVLCDGEYIRCRELTFHAAPLEAELDVHGIKAFSPVPKEQAWERFEAMSERILGFKLGRDIDSR